MSPIRVSQTLLVFVALCGFRCGAEEAYRTPEVAPGDPSLSRGQVVPTGSMSSARAAHTATLLPSGQVLLAGGMEGAGATAELYDPAQASFAAAGRLASERAGGHTATLLAEGKVLLAGGWTSQQVTRSAELFDPATGSFALTGPMNTPRSGFTATLLPTGKVLLAGGFDGNARLASAELYDPQKASSPPRAT